MTKMRLLALLAVVALVLFPAIAIAQAPELPCRFYGTVQVNGADVPDGTVIQALIDGNVTATTTTPAAGYGASSYALIITQPEGVDYTGKTVSFTIGGNAVTTDRNLGERRQCKVGPHHRARRWRGTSRWRDNRG